MKKQVYANAPGKKVVGELGLADSGIQTILLNIFFYYLFIDYNYNFYLCINHYSLLFIIINKQ